MIGRSLTRRLEHLETRLLPVAGEPTVITLDFVDTNGTVLDHKEFTVAAPPRTNTARGRDYCGDHWWPLKDLDRRLARLEDRLAPTDFARDPRQRLRVVVCDLGRTLETSTCRRTLSADGSLFEILRLDGTREGLSDVDLETFIGSFPIESV